MKCPQKLVAPMLMACLVSPAQAFIASRSVPPASFLHYHVDTVSELTFEVTYDQVVQARLAHHFHLSGQAMCAYVRDNLVLKRLAAPYRTRVYCISPRGREYFVVMTLKRGTPVFALRRTGQPILRLVCGNPLVAALPPSAPKAAAARPRPPVQRVKPTLLERAATPAAPVASVPAAPSLPFVTTVSGSPSEMLFTQVGSGGSPGWLGWLPVLGGVIGVLSHGGGAHGGTPSVSGGPGTPPLFVTSHGGPPTPPVQPVPEPSPACVLLIGALALGAWRVVGKRA